MDKLCCDCSYMDHELGGEESWDVLLCEKRHFNSVVSVSFIRDNIRRATTCPDFTTEPVERPALTFLPLPSIGWLVDLNEKS